MELWFRAGSHAGAGKFNAKCGKVRSIGQRTGAELDKKLNKAREIAKRRREEMRQAWKRVLKAHYKK